MPEVLEVSVVLGDGGSGQAKRLIQSGSNTLSGMLEVSSLLVNWLDGLC